MGWNGYAEGQEPDTDPRAAELRAAHAVAKSLKPLPALSPAQRDEAHGAKHDQDKPRLALLPFDALEQVGAVLTFGARKYSAHSWRGVPDGIERYTSALLRHLCALQRGERTDRESGLPHAAHVACNGLFLAALWAENEE